MHSNRWRRAAIGAVAILTMLLLPVTTLATYPAPTGTIAFSADAGSGAQIWTVRPNGHDLRAARLQEIHHQLLGQVAGYRAFNRATPDQLAGNGNERG